MSKKNLKKAYSLIELSIVIVIISILITGALSVSVGSVNNAKIKLTNDRMKELYKALGNYLVIYKKLPCPADLTQIKSSSSTYGTSIGSDGSCSGSGVYTSASEANLVYGMIPSKTLGLSAEMAEDGFESKIAYIVDKRLTDSSTFYVNFAQGTPDPTPLITITEKPSNLQTTADFAIVSYGANKSGSFGANSSTQVARSSDSDELDNDVNQSSPYFNVNLISTSGNSDTFDDAVFAKKRTNMLTDFNALSLIPCPAYNPSDVTYGATNIVWPAGSYDQVVVATTNCPAGYTSGVAKPTKRCGAFGNWQSGVVNPCLAP